MEFPFYWIDAFTDRAFAGNPAGVVPLTAWPDDAFMQRMACAVSTPFLFCAFPGNRCGSGGMSAVPPPNDALAELVSVLGDDNVRTLVRTFLRDFPAALRELQGGDRKNRHRVAHSMKSNSRLMGAQSLSQRMAALETRLDDVSAPDVTPQDIAAITLEFEEVAGPLRAFVGA